MSETHNQLYATKSDLTLVMALARQANMQIQCLREEIAALKAPTEIDLSGAVLTQDLLDAMQAAATFKIDSSIFKKLNPADLPADHLLNYDQIVHLMGPDPLRRQTIEKYALNEGYEDRIPRGFRRSPKTAVVWYAADIAKFFKCKPSTEVSQ